MSQARVAIVVGMLLALAGVTKVTAEPLEFTATGGLFGTDPATFTLNSTPTPSQYNATGFGINEVPVSYDGSTIDYNLGFGGPSFPFFEYATSGSADFGVGTTPLFTGPTSSPTFKIGNFTFEDAETASTLTVDVSAAPEPPTWLFMIAGIGGIGFLLRRVKSAQDSRPGEAFAA